MPTNDEWRQALGRDDLTEEEVAEFAQAIRNLIAQYLDQYFRDEFEPDDL
jgi:hypothetical protein